jgi:hypothetical protein
MTNNADDDDVDLASLLISGGPGGKLNYSLSLKIK